MTGQDAERADSIPTHAPKGFAAATVPKHVILLMLGAAWLLAASHTRVPQLLHPPPLAKLSCMAICSLRTARQQTRHGPKTDKQVKARPAA